VDALMSENDENHDGVIDFNEFKNAMKSVREKSRKSSSGMDIEH
jgi:Ca2+-binding EF-hand superfamily protein